MINSVLQQTRYVVICQLIVDMLPYFLSSNKVGRTQNFQTLRDARHRASETSCQLPNTLPPLRKDMDDLQALRVTERTEKRRGRVILPVGQNMSVPFDLAFVPEEFSFRGFHSRSFIASNIN